jgi:GTPase SAR1 family protein
MCLELFYCLHSAGKSTIINALLRGHYNPTSAKHETQIVSKFCINVNGSGEGTRKRKADDSNTVDMCEGSGQTIESIHRELKEKNARHQKSQKLEEISYPINVDNFLGEMREDTALTLIDVPGLNNGDADKKKRILEWVKTNWSTFDCVILVMDAKTGVDTSDAVETLKLVEYHCRETRTIPVIILCNKVDDPNNKDKGRKSVSIEQMEIEEMVLQSQKEIEKIFNVSDRKLALEEFLDKKESSGEPYKMLSPAFLPISARFALLFYSAKNSKLTLEELKKLPIELIDQFGLVECMFPRMRTCSTLT